ncbi:TPA: G5 domain-containing protein, partial [Streptococcus suis]|nr:G5 domain-containing protein [Streptococcus suis]
EVGKEVVETEGVNGERTIVYTVTKTEGVETARTVKSDSITTPATAKVIKVGAKKIPLIEDENQKVENQSKDKMANEKRLPETGEKISILANIGWIFMAGLFTFIQNKKKKE